jgi:deoxyribodipyrimidine photo-lyase
LRLIDHEPISAAVQSELPVLLVYCFEPSIMEYDDSDLRHWRFVHQSLMDMQGRLHSFNQQLHVFHSEALDVFGKLNEKYHIQAVFSHQEIGNRITFDRDIAMQKFIAENGIEWREYQHNGVVRRLKSRTIWDTLWHEFMAMPQQKIDLNQLHTIALDQSFYHVIKGPDLPPAMVMDHTSFQPGGESFAWKYLESFLNGRYVNYSKHISKPALSRKGCSRISPYLTYGNLSMRSVYQSTMAMYNQATNKRALSNFVSRLHWHCHFMQKFEDECRMEFEHVNRVYNALSKPKNERYITAWQKGQTGVPLVDACMRCLVETGYINFRMRAMVVSFFVFNLWQDWRELHFLARQFLDYEPGIHYPQLQMQSGVTGINTVRVYNPIKNSKEHDADGIFIKKWIPELQNVPIEFVHEPWTMSSMEQMLYGVVMGQDYPLPIVDVEATQKVATEIMWSYRKKEDVKREGKRILKKHVNTARS